MCSRQSNERVLMDTQNVSPVILGCKAIPDDEHVLTSLSIPAFASRCVSEALVDASSISIFHLGSKPVGRV